MSKLSINTEELEELALHYGDNEALKHEVVVAINDLLQVADKDTTVADVQGPLWLLYQVYKLFKI